MNPHLEVGTSSTAGRREENQDHLAEFESPFGYVIVVADGMGGYEGGSIASQLAVSRLPQLMATLPSTLSAEEALSEAVAALSLEIREHGGSLGTEGSRMGSTLAALLFQHTDSGLLAIAGHVGDSRVYFFRGGRLFCLTRDHTVAQELVNAGALREDQAAGHPQAHVLTRALGHTTPLVVDFSSWTLVRPGDLFLLCSDGLSGCVPDEEIREVLSQHHDADLLAQQLVDLALEFHSADNISTVVVRVNQDATPEPQ